jgi:hypothetical protein
MLAALEGDAFTPPPTSADRLHRHALETVFAFCSLRELAAVLEVSKDWTAAVGSMRPLGVDLPSTAADAWLLQFCLSPLPRHVSKADIWRFPLSCWSLYHLKQRMPNLEELNCSFEGSWLPLMFPVRLRKLSLRFQAAADIAVPFSDKQHRELDEAIVAIAALPLLDELSLSANKANSCCLTPLTTVLSLRKLWLTLPERVFDSPANIEAFRNMPHLRSLYFDPSPAAFIRMLQPPHSLQLESLHVLPRVRCSHRASTLLDAFAL